MNKNNTPKFSHQIKKDLTVIDFGITIDGLEIGFVHDGKEHTILVDEVEAALLLKKYGIVEDARGGDVKVEWFDERMKWMDWRDYVMHHRLSQSDAIMIAVGETEEAGLNAWAHEVSGIPALINNFLNPAS